jgi:microsomal dipeptidase-like Zn-dependent dipeptidase
VLGIAGLLLIAGTAAALLLLPARLDRALNRAPPGPYEVSERAAGILSGSVVVDLHADPLLWNRDLTQRHDQGQVDLPRLLEGGVALQTFGVATKTPVGLNFERNASDAADMMTALAVAQRWPLRTWGSLLARALFQATRLDEAIARADGQLVRLQDARSLENLLARRAAGEKVVGAVLAIEGLHALEGELANVDLLFDAGFRMMGLSHFFDNEAAGSSAGEEKYGLTPLGREMVERMEALGITVDLAHAAPAAIRDTLSLATKPVVVSHTGVQATCPGPRNLSDDEVLGVAENGGVIGIGYFEGAVCDTSPRGIVRAMDHVRRLVGVRHLALGSDFDGSIAAAFDTTGLGLLVDAMLEAGFSEPEIRLVLGGNALRVLRATLPAAPAGR